MLTEFDAVFKTLEAHSGITVANAHREYMEKLILERISDMEISSTEYTALISRDDAELSYLTNAAAVNETYFFREERQFDFLKNTIFMQRKESPLHIWSASCSTGEEPLSIYTLAKFCGLSCSISASDIDTDALASFKAGQYTTNSFRTDGSKYRPLIEQIGSWKDDKMIISPDVISNIHIFPYNLASASPPPLMEGSIDIIFMRNVFIYFTTEVRKRILNKLAKSLKDDGIVILSINEVGNIDKNGIPFDKLHSDTIYYLQKRTGPAVRRATPPVIPAQVHDTKPETKLPANPRQPLTLFTKDTPSLKATGKAAELPRQQQPANAQNPSLQELYKHIDGCIGRHDYEGAEKSLEAKVFKPHEMEFKYYFAALIGIEQNRDDQAVEILEKSVMLNSSFWPARYKLALLRQKRGEEQESRKQFEACCVSIEKYRKDAKSDYDFLLGDFCPEYFEMLCRNYLKNGKEG
ncbi:MAG: hypothetical protein J6Y13_07500 [Treponema sp.]|nr:hypothetical protein [Treponema sp.]